jgi:hypothetical protein
MKRLYSFSCSISLAVIAAIGAPACADTFNFALEEGTGTITGGLGNIIAAGSGTLTAVPDASIPGAFEITALSGTFGAGMASITELPCVTYSQSHPCYSSSLKYDNLLYPVGLPPFDIVVLDDRGLGLDIGGRPVQVYASSSHFYGWYDSGEPAGAPALGAYFAVTPTPEPCSFLLLGTGLLGIAGSFRRRRSPAPIVSSVA